MQAKRAGIHDNPESVNYWHGHTDKLEEILTNPHTYQDHTMKIRRAGGVGAKVARRQYKGPCNNAHKCKREPPLTALARVQLSLTYIQPHLLTKATTPLSYEITKNREIIPSGPFWCHL